MVIDPDVIARSPAIAPSSVLLPDPFAPMTAVIVPPLHEAEKSVMTLRFSRSTDRCEISIIAIATVLF
jgi:hypothetical protein